MRNEESLMAMRPDLSHLFSAEAGTIESFQNGCLRPILKMQHDLLIAVAKELPQLTLLISRSNNVEDSKKKTIGFFKQQNQIKYLIIGLVAGHFTLNEWKTYSVNSNEFNKRIINMSGERVGESLFDASLHS